MKTISIVTPCYNEEGNIEELYKQVRSIFETELKHYSYEHIFIDNASADSTVDILKKIAQTDRRVKIIVNSRNFGHIKSPVHGMFQATGDAVISVVADLQDPPSMIPLFVKKWEEGNDIVVAIKRQSEENGLMFKIRETYYKTLEILSEVKIFKNYTGFGLYDKKVMNALRQIEDPYPFFRGMIAEVGFNVAQIDYDQPVRIRGVTKNNFYSLYDIGMLGIINNSKIPLRMATFAGFTVAFLSLMVGIVYLILKIVYWNSMPLGVAPIIIGGTFMFAVLLFFFGIIGEYIGAIYTQVLNRPLVFEKERINF